ncbi:fibronectin type III domain-containing protein [Corallococcus coralloides]|uniref:Fibronectin type III domain-containing protein n=1 Tax=Corallococcus coralloides TaxID=184914 RepID=A0A410RY33_CORCK|nr:MXAN_2561 family MXYO-CTERM-anchored protein [Corallococcus coralloides]QAT86800.1 fibronectin type III domain-containing protein [Corallococcus coralloides]
MRLPFIGLLLFASTAVAQTGPTVTFTSATPTTSNNTVTVPRSECGNARRFSWSRTGNICGGSLFIYATTGSCGGEPTATDLKLVSLGSSDTTASGTVNFSVQQVLAARGGGTDGGPAATCDSQTSEISFNLCASARQVGGYLGTECQTAYANVGSPTFVLKYDPQPPATPSIAAVIARDSALSVQVDGAEADSTVIVEVAMVASGDAGTDTDAGTDADAGTDVDAGTEDGGQGLVGALALEGTTGPVTRVDKAAGEGNVVIPGLTNGVTYRLQAIIRDAAGNESPASAAVDATPVKSNGLFDAYVDAGGQERGGCAATGGGIAGGAVLAALGIWLSSRRKVS